MRPSSSIVASNVGGRAASDAAPPVTAAAATTADAAGFPDWAGARAADAAGAGRPPPKSPSTSSGPTGTSRQSWTRGTGRVVPFEASSSCCWNESTRRDMETPLRARQLARSSSRAFAAIWSDTRLE